MTDTAVARILDGETSFQDEARAILDVKPAAAPRKRAVVEDINQRMEEKAAATKAAQTADRAAKRAELAAEGTPRSARPPKGKTSDFTVAPPNAKNVTPKTKAIVKKAAPTMKASVAKSKVKAAPLKAAPKAAVERVPAEEFVAFLKAQGIGKSQAAKANGVSPSLVSEWSGSGRKQLLHRGRWVEVQKAIRAYVKSNLTK